MVLRVLFGMPFAYAIDGFHLVFLYLHSVLAVIKRVFSMDHAMNFPTGSYPTIRHKEYRDYTANASSVI